MTFRTVVRGGAVAGHLGDLHAQAVHAHPGSGMHTHVSLFEGDRNAFFSGSEYQLSKTGGPSSPAS